jgi:hypothetical protein
MFGACGNEYLLATIEHYMRLSLPVRAKTLADPASLSVSHAQQRLMIDMLQGRSNWLLARICISHLQPSKKDCLARADPRPPEVTRRPDRHGHSPEPAFCTTYAEPLSGPQHPRARRRAATAKQQDRRIAKT